ncbi:MAG: SpoIIE family protein phosphatase [Phycisphaerales bacterium]|nr:SpoIIE family protein phosphatase [Phycisphaerales bacterium]
MELTAKRYVRWVLIIHLLLLVGVLVLVFAAVRETYYRARDQVLVQVQDRQQLLGSQMAQAIQDYYAAIHANLQLIKQAQEIQSGSQATDFAARQMAQILWDQLRQRCDLLMIIKRSDRHIDFVLPQASTGQATQITAQADAWLAQVHQPSVSPYMALPSGGANLVAIPLGQDDLVVVNVPIQLVSARFLDMVNAEAAMSATLLDSTGRTMATSDPSLVGASIYEHLNDQNLRQLFQQYMADPKLTSVRIEHPLHVGNLVMPARLVTAVPIVVQPGGLPTSSLLPGVMFPGQRPWTLFMSSHLSVVDNMVRATFGRAMIWAAVVGLVLTVILVSTAIQMIRARLRLERQRNQAIRTELDQARKIQLAWLPLIARHYGPIRIAAVNQAANHISGDFYDWFDLPDDRTVVTIGDVTGHGMSAAFLMATTQLMVRNTMPRLLDPGACLTEVNHQLCNQVFSGQFVTMLIMVLDRANRSLQVATAGHFPPLLSHGDEYTELKMEAHLVLGVEPDELYTTETFNLPERCRILLYTDGVPDAANPKGERFGFENLIKALAGRANTVQACIDQVLGAVAAFRGQREIVDDLTIVATSVHAATDPDQTAVAVAAGI